MSPDEKTPLRLGFVGGATNSAVGYTHFSSSHLDGFFRLDAGVFSRDPATSRASGRTYEVADDRVYADWRALLEGERGRLDAIAVLTPTPSHAEIVSGALAAGYPVICEKALATASADCLALHDQVLDSGGFLAVTFNYSGYPMVRELRELVCQGVLGKIQQIQVEMPQEGFARLGPGGETPKPQSWRLSDYRVPTLSLDLGVHIHHLLHFVSGGARPLDVSAQQSTYGHFGSVVDSVNCLARYSGDISVNIWFSKAAIGYRNGLRLRVFGSQGSAEWLQVEPDRLQLASCDGRRQQLDLGSNGLLVAGLPRYNRFKPGHPAGFIEAFANLYADIAEALRHHLDGDEASNPYVFGADHAAEGLSFLEAIDAAARSRVWETLPELTTAAAN